MQDAAVTPDRSITDFLTASGLIGDLTAARFRPLPGGVSSDIWLVEAERVLCVKRALPQLRVEAEWHAPVERSLYEAAWLKGVATVLPQAVPHVLAEDARGGIFAMDYLDPAHYACWKAELLGSRVDEAFAGGVGERLAAIHSTFARDRQAPRTFATDAIFRHIRIDPYLLATAGRHPDLGPTLGELAERTLATRRTVVHGDVSPKNIMIGPEGPVFLDAECAWYGDPAFDLAFCLNHLLLKTVAVPGISAALLGAFSRLTQSYISGVDWEPAREVEMRAASLLPALLLARIDGKSPVEYITHDRDKHHVRMVARRLLADAPQCLGDVAAEWTAESAKGVD
jgi:aminoglycoside phosphotransferase (APT) family kinase protein